MIRPKIFHRPEHRFGSTAVAFSGGRVICVEFEPHATALEQKGDGYVVASLGEESVMPYTAFSRKSYLEAHPDAGLCAEARYGKSITEHAGRNRR
ncbi:MAG: hypothetical protein ACLURV_11210 [Gallintestinimicrobium sp.]